MHQVFGAGTLALMLSDELGSFVVEDGDEFGADDFALLLRIGDAGESGEETLGGIHGNEVEAYYNHALMREYLALVRREAKVRFDAGMPAEAAARDIKLGVYASWREAERILPNVMRCYQEFRDETHLLEDQQDVTPMGLAYQAIELGSAQNPLDASLRRVIRAMKQ